MGKARIDPDKTWFVVRTNIKCEQKAATNLGLAGFDVYLPRMRIEKWNKRSNTYRTIERPLMLRYLFLGMPRRASDRHFGFARSCEGVESILGDGAGNYVPVPHALVEEIYLAEIDLQFDDTKRARKHREGALDKAFPVGRLVVIEQVESILDGLVAEVIETNGDDRIRVSLGLLKTWVKREHVKAA